MDIVYIPGETNTVADAPSRVLPNAFLDETDLDPHAVWTSPKINAILRVRTDISVLNSIKSEVTENKTNSVRNSCRRTSQLRVYTALMIFGTWGTDYSSLAGWRHPRKPCSDWHMIQQAILAPTNHMLCYGMHITGLICVKISSSHIFPPCADCQHNKSSTKEATTTSVTDS